jgi:nitrite reductase/ring-hydroxylating ferredoxin subunit
MTIQQEAPRVCEDTAYGRPAGRPDSVLFEVGPGTPCGEYLRRYWQPISASDRVTQRPRQVRLLGEDLILFRDGQGKPGLLYPYCAHRGTSLLFGKVDDNGIRCCYHGWQFDVEGHCLDQPCEATRNVNRRVYRQPWYPVEERYGLVWAYLGPPEKMPLLPQFEHLELQEGEHYFVLDNSFQAHADVNGPEIIPISWMNINDNAMDQWHTYILHSNISGIQFDANLAVLPSIKWEEHDQGVISVASRLLPDGRELKMVRGWIAPNMSVNPSGAAGPTTLSIFTAVDDTHMRAFLIMRVGENFSGRPFEGLPIDDLKPWSEMSVEERQDNPGDYEAQVTQGPNGIQLHSEEHLAGSDAGIILLRKVLKREISKVANGEDPLNIAFVPGTELISTVSRMYFAEPVV